MHSSQVGPEQFRALRIVVAGGYPFFVNKVAIKNAVGDPRDYKGDGHDPGQFHDDFDSLVVVRPVELLLSGSLVETEGWVLVTHQRRVGEDPVHPSVRSHDEVE